MTTELQTKLLQVVTGSKGHFATSGQLASQIQVPEWQVRQELDRLLIMLRIDKFELMADGRTTSFYGHHRGVRPGQAALNQAAKGLR